MQVLTGTQRPALKENMSTPSVMTGIGYTSRGHLFQMFVSKRYFHTTGKSTLRGLFLSENNFQLKKSVSLNTVKST